MSDLEIPSTIYKEVFLGEERICQRENSSLYPPASSLKR